MIAICAGSNSLTELRIFIGCDQAKAEIGTSYNELHNIGKKRYADFIRADYFFGYSYLVIHGVRMPKIQIIASGREREQMESRTKDMQQILSAQLEIRTFSFSCIFNATASERSMRKDLPIQLNQNKLFCPYTSGSKSLRKILCPSWL